MSVASAGAGTAFANSAAHPNYTSSGTIKLIPEIWSTKMLVKFYRNSVFGAIANTEYEGEIKKFGDKVHIRTRPDITIRPWTRGLSLEIENPGSASVELNIDKATYYAFISDVLDEKQSDLNYVEEWTQDAAEQQKLYVDNDILTALASKAGIYDAAAGGKFGAATGTTTDDALQVTKDNVLGLIVDMMTALDERNIPESDRFVVMPPWMAGLIKKSDLKDASLTGDGTSILRNGRIGMIDRASVYTSNALPTGENIVRVAATHTGEAGNYACYFGQKSALTFASQLLQNEGPLTDAKVFGKIYRGLQVYGYEVLKSDALGLAVVKQ